MPSDYGEVGLSLSCLHSTGVWAAGTFWEKLALLLQAVPDWLWENALFITLVISLGLIFPIRQEMPCKGESLCLSTHACLATTQQLGMYQKMERTH